MHWKLTWAQSGFDVLEEEIEGSRSAFLMINNQDWNQTVNSRCSHVSDYQPTVHRMQLLQFLLLASCKHPAGLHCQTRTAEKFSLSSWALNLSIVKTAIMELPTQCCGSPIFPSQHRFTLLIFFLSWRQHRHTVVCPLVELSAASQQLILFSYLLILSSGYSLIRKILQTCAGGQEQWNRLSDLVLDSPIWVWGSLNWAHQSYHLAKGDEGYDITRWVLVWC